MRFIITPNIYTCVAALLWAAMFVSCENDIAEVDKLIEKTKTPDTEIEKYNLIFCDSGRVSMSLVAGKIVLTPDPDNYGMYDKRISRGMEIIIYKKGTDSISAKITSKAGIEHEFSGLAEAIGNVVVINDKNDTLTTERLFWNKQTKIVYTDRPSRIKNQDQDLHPRNGFEASEDFRWYKLFNSQGDINIKDSLNQAAAPTEELQEATSTQELELELQLPNIPATQGSKSTTVPISPNPSGDTPESIENNKIELKKQRLESMLKKNPKPIQIKQ